MKRILRTVLALTFALFACSLTCVQATDLDSAEQTNVLRVAAAPIPHAELVEQVKPILAQLGIELRVTAYADEMVPYTSVENGLEDVCFFGDLPHLTSFNETNSTSLVSVGPIIYQPMGIYPGFTTSLEELPKGAVIQVPGDKIGKARALHLLEDNGLLTLEPETGLNATTKNIAETPLKLKLREPDEIQLMMDQAVETGEEFAVDLFIRTADDAILSGFSLSEDALALESPEADGPQAYAHVMAVKKGMENDYRVRALYAALSSETARAYLTDSFRSMR